MRQHMKWVYAVAGSGLVVGILNYFQETKRCAHMSWTTNFTPSVKWDTNWDRREFTKPNKSALSEFSANKENETDEEKQKASPTATRHLILVRHGQYNLKGATDAEKQLTALGRSQAELTGLRLKEMNLTYSRIIQSTLNRAKETAALIHQHLLHLPLDSCNLLCEGAPIPPEPPIGHWKPEAHFFEDGARIEAAFRKYFHRADPSQKSDSYEILVCHANVIRYFVCRALQFPPEAWLRFSLHNCSLTWIAIRPSGRVVVFNVGDCGHLPPDMLTRS